MERPDFLDFSEITDHQPPSSQNTTNNNNKLADKERQYIQLKPLRNQKSFSEPVLSPNLTKDGDDDVIMRDEFSNNKRSNSSPFVLEGYISSRRSVAVNEMPITKEYYSLFCLGPTNPIRRLAINITDSKYPFLLFCLFVCVCVLFVANVCSFFYVR